MLPQLAEPVAREQIRELLDLAAAATPPSLEPDLPPGELTEGAPAWYPFERAIWQYGDRIRGVLDQCVRLRGDPELCEQFLVVAQDRRGKRGRQSFVLLFGYKRCAPFAARLAEEINDWQVSGHVIDSLIKMQARGFADVVRPFEADKFAWIRAKAKTYCRRFGP
jgi:hypothetical protein